MIETNLEQTIKKFHIALQEVEKRMVGQEQVIRHIFGAVLAGGHILLEDVPGTGKTTLALAIAKSLGLDFKRLQCTPDLLPSDVLGTYIYHPEKKDFSFRAGPIFTQLLLADEINRAVPRMQSALLEAMQEGKVSIEGQTMPLPQPFLVIATANPLESQGVFPLPEAQLDRFLIQLKLGYLSEDKEQEMVRRIRLKEESDVQGVLSSEELGIAGQYVKATDVSAEILNYIVKICRKTREDDRILVGASPRAIIALTSYAQALAFLEGRSFVIPDDVKEAFIPVLNHRLIFKQDFRMESDSTEKFAILQDILESVYVPVERIGV